MTNFFYQNQKYFPSFFLYVLHYCYCFIYLYCDEIIHLIYLLSFIDFKGFSFLYRWLILADFRWFSFLEEVGGLSNDLKLKKFLINMKIETFCRKTSRWFTIPIIYSAGESICSNMTLRKRFAVSLFEFLKSFSQAIHN